MTDAGYETVGRLYDRLAFWDRLQNRLRFGHRYAGFTVHKTLDVPSEERERYSPGEEVHFINDLTLAAAGMDPESRVLDIGCGFGGTIFRWQERAGGRYTGLTISRRQVRVARREALRRGIANQVRFLEASFDDPLDERFDVIIAIETLLHSWDISRTLTNLARHLKPGGRFLIVDDFMADITGVSASADYDLLKKQWRLRSLLSNGLLEGHLRRNGLEISREEDLTGQVRLLPEERLRKAHRQLQALHRWCPSSSLRTYLEAQIGGLALQRLYSVGQVRYRFLAARKK